MYQEQPALQVKDVTFGYEPGRPVLRDVSFKVNRNSILCVLGPSGCGKSTLLKIIAGLLNPRSGSICINGSEQVKVATADRDLGFVFQRNSLFPHLNVFDNIAFPFRHGRRLLSTVANEDWRPAVERILRLVRMEGFRAQNVTTLSGGQAQRVAIARALVYAPSLLLLDEPLSSLDNSLKRELIDLLLELHGELGNTFIFVTHDEREVARMATEVAVVGQDHTLVQIGPTSALYEAPETPEVALLLEDWNIFTCTRLGVVGEHLMVCTPWSAELSVPLRGGGFPEGPSVTVGLPVSEIRITDGPLNERSGTTRINLEVRTSRREAHRNMLTCWIANSNGLSIRMHAPTSSSHLQGTLLTGEFDDKKLRLFR